MSSQRTPTTTITVLVLGVHWVVVVIVVVVSEGVAMGFVMTGRGCGEGLAMGYCRRNCEAPSHVGRASFYGIGIII